MIADITLKCKHNFFLHNRSKIQQNMEKCCCWTKKNIFVAQYNHFCKLSETLKLWSVSNLSTYNFGLNLNDALEDVRHRA